MKMNKVLPKVLIYFFALCLPMLLVSEVSNIYNGEPSDLKKVGEFETDDCRLWQLEDAHKQLVLVKMIRSSDPEEQALLLIDSCAAAVAEFIPAPVNRVILLPNNKPWSDLEWYEQLATLHQWAPGCSAEESLPWEGFDLHQRYRVPGSLQYKKWGPLPDNMMGLSSKVIKTMAHHVDLCRIAALDTFLGNADRSLPNIYYNKEKQQFFGIDLAASFRRPLAAIAIKQLKRLSKEGFTKEEIEALKIYQATLISLYDAVSPDFIKSQLIALSKKSGLKSVDERLDMAASRFSENYADVAKLIHLLDEILCISAT